MICSRRLDSSGAEVIVGGVVSLSGVSEMEEEGGGGEGIEDTCLRSARARMRYCV